MTPLSKLVKSKKKAKKNYFARNRWKLKKSKKKKKRKRKWQNYLKGLPDFLKLDGDDSVWMNSVCQMQAINEVNRVEKKFD